MPETPRTSRHQHPRSAAGRKKRKSYPILLRSALNPKINLKTRYVQTLSHKPFTPSHVVERLLAHQPW